MSNARACLGLLAALVLYGADDDSGGRLVKVGDHRLFSYCSGASSTMTVVLVNGLGAGLEIWKSVQSDVGRFAKVCSYDRAGEGHSDRISHLQSPNEVVSDLRRLLEAEGSSGPYVMVGWSLGGIYVRAFAQQYPSSIAGIVLVDSSHEEQYSHYAAISTAIAERYATQDGRFDRNEFLQAAGQLKPGNHLKWHLDVPLIVLEHSRPSGPPRTDADRLAVDWHDLQIDLSARSKFGKLIETRSGHMIVAEQPRIVVGSIEGVIKEAETLRDASRR